MLLINYIDESGNIPTIPRMEKIKMNKKLRQKHQLLIFLILIPSQVQENFFLRLREVI